MAGIELHKYLSEVKGEARTEIVPKSKKGCAANKK